MVRQITGYNPRSFVDLDREKISEAKASDIFDEERRSRMLGAKEDEVELKKLMRKRR
jgi:hypothetical protein